MKELHLSLYRFDPEKDRDIVRQLANEMEEKFINTFYIKKDEDLKP